MYKSVPHDPATCPKVSSQDTSLHRSLKPTRCTIDNHDTSFLRLQQQTTVQHNSCSLISRHTCLYIQYVPLIPCNSIKAPAHVTASCTLAQAAVILEREPIPTQARVHCHGVSHPLACMPLHAVTTYARSHISQSLIDSFQKFSSSQTCVWTSYPSGVWASPEKIANESGERIIGSASAPT